MGRSGWGRIGRAVGTTLVFLGVLGPPMQRSAGAPSSRRPNVLILMSDDQAWSTFSRALMPNVFAQMVDKGILFTRAYVNHSQCCPSRSEIMTGLFEHHAGVDNNDTALARPTIVQALHNLGYRTMLSGKYLNSWPCDPRPEFDNWICSGSGKSSYTLIDPVINVNGVWTQFHGYTTDIEAEFVTDFMAGTPADQPFFIMYTPTSPHGPANDPRCRGIPVDPYRPPSFDEDTMTDGKPAYMQRGPFTSDEVASVDYDHQIQTEAVECLDGSMGTVLDALGDREQNTLVIYLSDNGMLYGEHRRQHKEVPYEESVRIPFIVRYPNLLPESEAFTSAALIQNVDIAPTIADLVNFRWGADGKSLLPIVARKTDHIRSAALTEFCQVSYPCKGSGKAPPSFFGVVTSQFAYIEYWKDTTELYDLQSDPFELVNLSGDASHGSDETEMARQLAALEAPPPVDTTIVSGPSGVVPGGVHTFVYFSQSRLATYECRLDKDGGRGSWFGCDGQSVLVGPLGSGTYQFVVRGADEFGSVDPTPARRHFSIP